MPATIDVLHKQHIAGREPAGLSRSRDFTGTRKTDHELSSRLWLLRMTAVSRSAAEQHSRRGDWFREPELIWRGIRRIQADLHVLEA